MAYLMNVKDRQDLTDEMFDPLKETIELLKFYDQDLSEEVNVLLQVRELCRLQSLHSLRSFGIDVVIFASSNKL